MPQASSPLVSGAGSTPLARMSDCFAGTTYPPAPSLPRFDVMMGPAELSRWKVWFARARATFPAAQIFASHPRLAALTRGASVGACLAGNADVADAVSDPAKTVFHFLEVTAADPAKRPDLATDWKPLEARHWARLGLHANARAPAQSIGLPLPQAGLKGLPIRSAGALQQIIDAPLEARQSADARNQATALLDRVLDGNPDHPQAALAMADILTAHRDFPRAHSLRAKA